MKATTTSAIEDAAADAKNPKMPRARRTWRPWNELASRAALLLALLLVATWILPDFASVDNLRTILRAVCTVGIMAFGGTLVLLVGELDLSVGGVAVVSGIVGGLAIQTGSTALVVALTVATGLFCGLVNGLLVTKLKVPSLIVTLGTLGITRALANIFSNGRAMYPDALAAYLWLGRGTLAGIPVPVVIFIATGVGATLLARCSRVGRAIYAVGSNATAARMSGIRVDKVKLFVFAIGGVTAALAGMLETARLSYIEPGGFNGIELSVIAVATLGGVSLFGGRGTIEGVGIASLIIAIVNNAMNMAGMSSYLQQIVTAGVILVVVLPDSLRQKDHT